MRTLNLQTVTALVTTFPFSQHIFFLHRVSWKSYLEKHSPGTYTGNFHAVNNMEEVSDWGQGKVKGGGGGSK